MYPRPREVKSKNERRLPGKVLNHHTKGSGFTNAGFHNRIEAAQFIDDGGDRLAVLFVICPVAIELLYIGARLKVVANQNIFDRIKVPVLNVSQILNDVFAILIKGLDLINEFKLFQTVYF
jgi:hypothetical protein